MRFHFAMQNKIKVLYIAGCGRTGSTLIGNILGEVQGFAHVGELREIWSNLAPGRPPCGCGTPVPACKVWSRVLDTAYGHTVEAVASRMRSYLAASTSFAQFRAATAQEAHWDLDRPTPKPLEDLQKLYRAIQGVFNCDVIVDSSKLPMYMHKLLLIGAIDLYVIHLVRDPRAWAYAFLRRVVREGYVLHMTPFQSARQWNRRNWAVEILRSRLQRRPLQLRYEDFVADPRACVRRILGFVNASSSLPEPPSEHSVRLGLHHTVSGNPNRFNTGVIEIKQRCEWKTRMKRHHKLLVTAAAMPLLMKYRYVSDSREIQYLPSAGWLSQKSTQHDM